MVLRTQIKAKIINEVIRNGQTAVEYKNRPENLKWRVLVVDSLTLKIVSSVIKMHELASEGIINVEIIERRRADMPNEAIYLITPTLKNVQVLVKDFQNENQPKYSAAQICFTENCHDDIFKKLEMIPNQFIKDLKEVNMSFVPMESQVYSLEKANGFQWHNNQQYQSNENRPKTKEELEKMAEQLATLCSTLGECPAIRYHPYIT